MLTVNLVPQSEATCATVDTNNLGQDVLVWLENTGFAKSIDWIEPSGMWLYPQVIFDRNKLMKADPEGYREHMKQWEERQAAKEKDESEEALNESER